MTTKDKRLFSRIDSLNLLSYSCTDDSGQVMVQGMGRTLNVSQGGILLETHAKIDPKYTISLTIGLEEDLVDINGDIVHCSPGKDENFESGIQFHKMDEAALQILIKYIKAFKEQYGSEL
ncbi:MAG: PilZ domain-containing protein [Desulfobacterales bacterium]|nr:MAG: PilZ domain-containing protein [Desulfobacterales bacterium]UCD89560.1 MAG: PilZ domain-containing protein [Desulfobacterales bacterium]